MIIYIGITITNALTIKTNGLVSIYFNDKENKILIKKTHKNCEGSVTALDARKKKETPPKRLRMVISDETFKGFVKYKERTKVPYDIREKNLIISL